DKSCILPFILYTHSFFKQWATFARTWYLLDGWMQPPGKLAAIASVRLEGKHKPIYHIFLDQNSTLHTRLKN
uniref:Uncharacterized protein n=1 Tax=Laticauda laticaudata TaxID=8630 RepID=A0A8C5S6U2_LATLA